LVLARPADERLLRQNAETYKEKLRALDGSFAAGVSQCPKREFIHAGHYAFGYLARRYHLTYVAAQGFVPDSEPTAKQLAARPVGPVAGPEVVCSTRNWWSPESPEQWPRKPVRNC
jgi:ABC-type Zn uptake system ZnuABC Zn-binding protein ZnuA